MKKHKLLVLSSLVAMLAMLLFAGCKKEAPSVAQVSPASNMIEDGAPEALGGNEFEFFTVYANATAQGYKALAGKAKVIKTNMQGPGVVTARVVLSQDLKLVLQKVEYDEATNQVKPIATLFSINGKSGEVYEFDGDFSETIPRNQLFAENQYLKVTYPLVDSGMDGLPNGATVDGQPK